MIPALDDPQARSVQEATSLSAYAADVGPLAYGPWRAFEQDHCPEHVPEWPSTCPVDRE